MIAAVVAAGGYIVMTKDKSQKVCNVYFPFKRLKTDATLIDPSNLEYVYQFYLLENLAAGLLQDDAGEAEGFKGVLAESWRKPDETTWSFKLRKDLKWSDGSPIDPGYLRTYYEDLKKRDSRHIVYLRALRNVIYDEKSRQLSFVFEYPVGRAVLHELALADATLLHPTNTTRDWKVTSGAYFVSEYAPEKKKLCLEANPYSPLVEQGSPRRVCLVDGGDMTAASLKSLGINLFQISSLSFKKEYQEIIEKAGSVKQGEFDSISFFMFNPAHDLSGNIQARREFGYIVQEALKGLKPDAYLAYDNQMVPPGYSGRLNSYPERKVAVEVLRGKTLSIDWHPAYNEMGEMLKRLKDVAAKEGVTLNFTFNAFTPAEGQGKPFGLFRIFKGNQKECLGSWTFLFTKDHGHLRAYRDEVAGLLDEAAKTASDAERLNVLLRLHRKVLDNAYAIPFLIQRGYVVGTNDVDLSKFNSFDMRLRFYDVRWR